MITPRNFWLWFGGIWLFVGLVIPHAARLNAGAAFSRVLPLSLVLGASHRRFTRDDLFEGLAPLARNLWWSWNRGARNLFRSIDASLWGVTRHNPLELLRVEAERRLLRRVATHRQRPRQRLALVVGAEAGGEGGYVDRLADANPLRALQNRDLGHTRGVAQHLNAWASQFTGFVSVQVGDDFDLNGKPHTAFNFTRIVFQHIEGAGTDGTQTQQGHS